MVPGAAHHVNRRRRRNPAEQNATCPGSERQATTGSQSTSTLASLWCKTGGVGTSEAPREVGTFLEFPRGIVPGKTDHPTRRT